MNRCSFKLFGAAAARQSACVLSMVVASALGLLCWQPAASWEISIGGGCIHSESTSVPWGLTTAVLMLLSSLYVVVWMIVGLMG